MTLMELSQHSAFDKPGLLDGVLRELMAAGLPLKDAYSALERVTAGVDAYQLLESGRVPSSLKSLRPIVLALHHWTCNYCEKTSGPFDVDHVFPKSRGGSNQLDNLVCACQRCNRSKGDRLVDDWLQEQFF